MAADCGRRRRCRTRWGQAFPLAWRWLRMDLGPGRPYRWAAARSLRASRVSGPQPDLSQAPNKSCGGGEITTRERVRYFARRPLSFRDDDLPAHGASHRGWHVTDSLAPGGATARDVLRDFGRTGEGSLGHTRRMGDDRNRARSYRSSCPGYAQNADADH